MRALVVGGSGSGKSAYAEQLAASLAPRRVYLATMRAEGAEAHARIERHRAQREGLNFATYETPTAASICAYARRKTDSLPNLPEAAVLLDDLGNLVANELFARDGSMAHQEHVATRIEDAVTMLGQSVAHLVVVADEVGSAGSYGDVGTDAWVRLVGTLCCRIAAHCDLVVEFVSGIPVIVKNELTSGLPVAAKDVLSSGIPVTAKSELAAGTFVVAKNVPSTSVSVATKVGLVSDAPVTAKCELVADTSVTAKCELVSDAPVTAKCALVADSPMAVEVEIP